MAGRILIIDPDLGNRLLLKSRLLGAYYAVDVAPDPADPALSDRAARCDLVLMAADPGGAHLAPLRRLRGSAATAHLPVILTPPAGKSDCSDLVAAGLAAGADDFLRPAGDDPVLMAKLRMHIRLKQMHDDFRPRAAGMAEAPTPAPAAGDSPPGAVWFHDPLPGQGDSGASSLLRRAVPALRPADGAEALLSVAAAWPGAAVAIDMTGPARAAAGLRLVARLRADPATRFTPLLMILAPGQEAAAAQGLDLGAGDFVLRGMAVAEMSARLAAIERRRRVAVQLRAGLIDGLRLALTDPLTGLHNRRHAVAQIPRMLARAGSARRPLALVILDVDRFKRINDRFGHACGDRVLATVARRLAGAVRARDLLARIGGEEFLVAMPGLGPVEAAAAAERLRAAVGGRPVPTGPGGPALEVTVSAGIAVAGPDAGLAFDPLFAAADGALLRSKRSGRNCIRLAPAA